MLRYIDYIGSFSLLFVFADHQDKFLFELKLSCLIWVNCLGLGGTVFSFLVYNFFIWKKNKIGFGTQSQKFPGRRYKEYGTWNMVRFLRKDFLLSGRNGINKILKRCSNAVVTYL